MRTRSVWKEEAETMEEPTNLCQTLFSKFKRVLIRKLEAANAAEAESRKGRAKNTSKLYKLEGVMGGKCFCIKLWSKSISS